MDHSSSSGDDPCTKDDTLAAIVDRCSLPKTRTKPVAKFCVRYGEDAHRVLTDAGLAPRLHYCSKVVGGVFTVVMDFVGGRDAYNEFKHRDLPRTVLDNVKRALANLHDARHVYRDMRRSNIMVVKTPKSRDDDNSGMDVEEWRGLRVYFDRQVGVVKYPPTLNTGEEIK